MLAAKTPFERTKQTLFAWGYVGTLFALTFSETSPLILGELQRRNLSISQTEIYATSTCTSGNVYQQLKNESVCIPSDSQPTLNVPASNHVTSKLIREYLRDLVGLPEHNSVTMVWMQGHRNVAADEIVDHLTRKDSELGTGIVIAAIRK
ncbi:hypothetical protein Trydic_g13562 [Trypoxylus dichotomus]